MVTAAKTMSQIATHMGVAFAVMYWMTGSAAFGGLAALLEPICNVMLLPVHERVWKRLRQGAGASRARYVLGAAEKISQVGLHMIVAFVLIYWATGSLAFGGLAAVLEPIGNVIALPLHDRIWAKIRRRVESAKHGHWATA